MTGSSVTDISPAPDEAHLVLRLQAGEEAAYVELLTLHGGRMLAAAVRLLGNETEAQDAVQEAFLSAFKGVKNFDGKSRLSTWLHRITVNASLMRLRTRKRKPEVMIEDLLPRFAPDGHAEAPVAAWNETSADLAERDEVRSLIREAIDQLPETYRTVLLLRDIEEVDTTTTAELLGVNENVVKTRLHRARQALRTLLDPHFTGGRS